MSDVAEKLINEVLSSSQVERLLRQAIKDYRGYKWEPSFSGRGYDLEFAMKDNAQAAWEFLYFQLEGSGYHVAKRGPEKMPGGMYWFSVYR